ncbi:MAG: RagB/SusD family nutrient uptake outer membrane protein [Bacteroidales bacterium]|nr:RagB/SusD family nutrient uptake outer membrane protein [Bacteroidales bacterium]MCF8336871.1 RagB/SusD family nutrient uptake outer membrane protein [Bacteroidales bacterium]
MRTIILFIALTIMASGCEILEVEPTDKIAGDKAINDLDGLKAAVNGSYDQLQSVGFAEDGIIFGDLPADNWIHVGSKKEYRQVDNNEILPSNGYIEGIWASCYDGINRINNIFAQVDNLEDTPESILNDYKGQSYFIRAINYFTLVKYFGGVPLRLKPTETASNEELFKPAATRVDTYKQIIADLKKADSLLPDEKINPSFANKYAAKALMARAYLYLSQYEAHWQQAANMADAVLQSGYFQLAEGENYRDLYDEEVSTNEVIFQVDFYNDDDQNAIADWVRHDGRLEVEAWETKAKENSIYHEYDEGDHRRDAAVYENGGAFYCNKYEDTGNGKDNVIILRLAEMYLIKAEALNEIGYESDGPAFEALNTLRERAGVSIYYSFDLSSQEAFREAVLKERRLELAFEGHRFFDLVRAGKPAEIMGENTTLARSEWLFPIPQSELDTNEEMTQNGIY